jgi:hypothetical protein
MNYADHLQAAATCLEAEPAVPEALADALRGLHPIYAKAILKELKIMTAPAGGWTAENIIKAIFPELEAWTVTEVSADTKALSSRAQAAALEDLSRKPEPPGGWSIWDVQSAISDEICRAVSNRPLTERDIEELNRRVNCE